MEYPKILLIVTAIFFLAISSIKAQDEEYYPTPGSSIASTSKGANTTVNEFTGAISVSIPLLSVKSESYTLPISLNYTSQGVKVGQIASWVGMGWNLNAGGVITRQVNDLPDDAHNFSGDGYLYNGQTVDDIHGKYFDQLSSSEEDYMFKFGKDSEPDIFYFNIGGGISGKFFFDKNGDTQLESQADLKIEYDLDQNYSYTTDHSFLTSNYRGLIKSFTITIPSGHIFKFEERSYSISNEEHQHKSRDDGNNYVSTNCSPQLEDPYREDFSGVDAVVTAWHLTSITNPLYDENDNPIGPDFTFDYTDELYLNHSNIFQWREQGCYSTTATVTHTSSSVESYFSKRLNKITYGNGISNYGEIDFISTFNRDDIYQYTQYLPSGYQHPKALSDIQHKSGSQIVKEYSFTYGWGTTNTNCTPDPAYMDAHKKRLQLSRLQEKNNGLALPEYDFTYDTQQMPPRHSASIDLWGYYSPNLTTWHHFLPTIYAYPDDNANNNDFQTIFSPFQRPASSYSGTEYEISGVDRNFNAAYAGAGILQKITSPLGSTTDIFYESNKFLFLGSTQARGGFRVKSTAIKDGNGNTTSTRYYYDSNEDGTGQTTGRLLEMPVFAVLRNPEICIHLGWLNQLMVSSLDRMGKGGTPPVGYSKVTKKVAHGKIVTEYNIPVKYGTLSHDNGVYNQSVSDRESPPIEIDNFPYPPNPNYSWRNGLPSNQKVYDDNGDLISATEYEYDLLDHKKIGAIRSVYTESTPDPDRYEWGKYYLISAFHRLVRKTVTNYDELSNTLTTETNYEYDSPHHHMLSASYTDNSDGLRHRTEYSYPQDESITELTDSWRIGSPVEVLKKVGPPGSLQTVAGQKIVYDNFFNASSPIPPYSYSIYAPNQFYSWHESTSTWELEKTHMNYYQTGLLMSYDAPGVPTTLFNIVNGELLWKRFNTDWKWDYTYYSDRMLHTATEPDGLTTTYKYDDLNRLESKEDRGGNRKDEYDYTLQLVTGGDNKVRTTFSYTGLSNIPPASEYYDGLGRSITTRLENYTPSGMDYVSSQEYDGAGRMTQQCDPASGGCTYYYYEDNPLNRLYEQKAPGWTRKPQSKYLVNTAADNVKKTSTTYYAAGSLYKYEYKDENYNYAYEFKDKLGRTVLKRRKVSASVFADTYFRYDEKGNLTYVIPPGAPNEASVLSFKYEYYDNGLIERKYIPGSGWYEFTYWANDLIKQETDPEGHITKYFYNTFNQIEYIKDGSDNILKEYTYSPATSGIDVGKVIGVDTRVLGTSDMLHTGYKYDQYGRVEMDTIDNYLGGRDEHTYTYDMNDNIKTIERDHYDSSSSTTPDKEVDKRYKYDDSGRLEAVFMSVDGGTEVQLSELEYDSKDRLVEKNLGVTSGGVLQSIDYRYNSRSWLTRINNVFHNGAQTPCDDDVLFMISGQGNNYDEEPQLKGTIAYTYDKEAVRQQHATSIDFHFDLQGTVGELQLKPFNESFSISLEGEAGGGVAAFETKTMEVEGLLTFEDAAKIIALNIKADIAQTAEATASDYSSETLHFLEQSIFHGVQAAASTPPPPPPNTAPENDLFAENLYYTSSNSDLNASAQYNGNVAYLRWRVGSRVIQNYGFTYDNLDRLTDARFAEYEPEDCPQYLNYGRYDVNIEYDDHRGNISSIDRNGLISGVTNFGAIDQITLVNEKNRIKFATENSLQNKGFKGSSGQMGYDNNGNLTNDPSRGITTTYNRLNLPEQITVNNGSFTGTITFVYDYDGNLLERSVSQSSPSSLSVTTEYVSGMEYVNGTLQSIYHEEGRYVKNGSNWHHEYVIRDHLGNNRVFFSDTNGNGFVSMSEVSQEAHYYPFGMTMQGSWLSTSMPKNKYRYNGIEQTANLGLDVYNAFYRTLDPSLARWWQVDPKGEVFYGLSPYNSMNNNPILLNDPNGDIAPLIAAGLIGAAIGGVGNTIYQATQGNIKTWGDGFAAFGIGAGAGFVGGISGGTIAGVGGGTALIGGSGFWATVGSGAAVGAAGGGTTGFLQGTGNALVFQDKNIGEALKQGLIEGGIGFVAGGILGGGFAAVTYKPVPGGKIGVGEPATDFPPLGKNVHKSPVTTEIFEDGVGIYKTAVDDNFLVFGGHVKKTGRDLVINNFDVHLQDAFGNVLSHEAAKGTVGIRTLFNIGRRLGLQEGVARVIINPGVRTTGLLQGTIQRQLVIPIPTP